MLLELYYRLLLVLLTKFHHNFLYQLKNRTTEISSKDLTGARIDYGHILEGTGINCPFGEIGTIGNNAEHRFFVTLLALMRLVVLLESSVQLKYSLLHRISPKESDWQFRCSNNPIQSTTSFRRWNYCSIQWCCRNRQMVTRRRTTSLHYEGCCNNSVFSLLHPGSGVIRVTPGVDQARASRPPAGGFINY